MVEYGYDNVMAALDEAILDYGDKLKLVHGGRSLRLAEVRAHIRMGDELAVPLYDKIAGLYSAAEAGRKNMMSEVVRVA